MHWSCGICLGCWRGRCHVRQIAQNFMDSAYDIFDTDLRLHEIAVGTKLFTAQSLGLRDDEGTVIMMTLMSFVSVVERKISNISKPEIFGIITSLT